MIVYEGDTMAYDFLPAVPVGGDSKEYWANYNKARLFVPKIYYYAVLAKELLTKYEADLAKLKNKRHKRQYLKKANKELKEELGEDIKQMSEIRGFFLVKLIHREVGKTAFEIIEEYRGKATASMWQTVSRLGGADLKHRYDGYGDDSYIELVVRDIEDGRIAYEDHTPKTETGKEVMSKRKKRREERRKKREAAAAKLK